MKNLSVHNLIPLIKSYLRERPAFMSFIRPQEALLFNHFKKNIKGKVLDFGCGDGFFAEVAFHKKKLDIGLEVTGNSRIEEAKKRKIYREILLYEGNVIPLKNDSIDTVVSNCVFEHIPKIDDSVREIFRVLKKGGYCITSVMTSHWSEMMLGSSFLGKEYAAWMNRRQVHESLLSKKQWVSLFKRTGFTIVEEVGYVNAQTAKWLDLFHYLSLPSLVWYMIFKRWNIPFFSNIFSCVFTPLVYGIIRNDVEKPSSSAIFFVLKKK